MKQRGNGGARGGGRGTAWPDPAVAERLLAAPEDPSRAAASGSPVDDLTLVLTAAARPLDTRPGDEAAALAAFRDARAGRASQPGRPLRSGPRGRRRGLTGKAFLGGAAAVLALGGVAVAANGGVPRPFHHHGHGVTPRPGTPMPVLSPSAPRPATTQAEPPAAGCMRLL